MESLNEAFNRLAKKTAAQAGRASTFALAVAVIVVWVVTGPLFGFSDTWQLVINTGTTIVTFLMVFLIQNTQNRDTRGDAPQARRADPGDRGRAQPPAGPRGAERERDESHQEELP